MSEHMSQRLELAKQLGLARPALRGEVIEPPEARRERMLQIRLSVLSDDDQQAARDTIDHLMGRIAHPETAGFIKSELVMSTLEGIRNKEDFDRRMEGYIRRIEKIGTTFDGGPIFKPELPALPE